MKNEFIKAMLIHVGTNLWYEVGNNRGGGNKVWQSAGSDKMRFDKKLFSELIEYLFYRVLLELGIKKNNHSHRVNFDPSMKGEWTPSTQHILDMFTPRLRAGSGCPVCE